jgi:hypothetical protein
VDIFTEDIADNLIATVWEPAVVKINALTAATEAACLLLSVDETIRNPTSNVVSYSLILIILSPSAVLMIEFSCFKRLFQFLILQAGAQAQHGGHPGMPSLQQAARGARGRAMMPRR